MLCAFSGEDISTLTFFPQPLIPSLSTVVSVLGKTTVLRLEQEYMQLSVKVVSPSPIIKVSRLSQYEAILEIFDGAESRVSFLRFLQCDTMDTALLSVEGMVSSVNELQDSFVL